MWNCRQFVSIFEILTVTLYSEYIRLFTCKIWAKIDYFLFLAVQLPGQISGLRCRVFLCMLAYSFWVFRDLRDDITCKTRRPLLEFSLLRLFLGFACQGFFCMSDDSWWVFRELCDGVTCKWRYSLSKELAIFSRCVPAAASQQFKITSWSQCHKKEEKQRSFDMHAERIRVSSFGTQKGVRKVRIFKNRCKPPRSASLRLSAGKISSQTEHLLFIVSQFGNWLKIVNRVHASVSAVRSRGEEHLIQISTRSEQWSYQK